MIREDECESLKNKMIW